MMPFVPHAPLSRRVLSPVEARHISARLRLSELSRAITRTRRQVFAS